MDGPGFGRHRFEHREYRGYIHRHLGHGCFCRGLFHHRRRKLGKFRSEVERNGMVVPGNGTHGPGRRRGSRSCRFGTERLRCWSVHDRRGSTREQHCEWDGSSWSALGSGITGLVLSLAASGSDVYAGGQFSAAGGVSANRIAKWDGNTWSALGTGINGVVNAIAISGSQVFAAGDFGNAGGTGVGRIAKWNGTTWSGLGNGLNGVVSALTVSGSDLYASGEFTASGTTQLNRIAKWDGNTWSRFGNGSEVPVSAVGVTGSSILASGTFSDAFGARFTGVGKWDGSSWSLAGFGSGAGLHSIARVIVPSGSDVYVGGSFRFAGDVQAYSVAKWNGSSWSAFPPFAGIQAGEIRAIAVSGNNVYVGVPAFLGVTTRLAKWDGTSWTTMAEVAGINALLAVGNDLYVSGSFLQIGGVQAKDIAKWDGSNWSGLNSAPVSGSGVIIGLAAIGTDIYAAGYFTTIGGVSANRIAKWNGTSWSALGSGLNAAVNSIAVQGTDIIVGGDFTSAGGNTANRVAKWNGSTWSSLGAGLNDRVFAVGVSGSNVIVGGAFTEAGEVGATRLAKWNGTSWSALGAGADDLVYAVAAVGSDVYAGGVFRSLGCRPSWFFGRYIGEQWAPSGGQDWHTPGNWGSGSIPSATANISITTSNATIATADASAKDLMISNGRTLTVAAGRTLTVSGNLNIGDGQIDGDGTVVILNCDPNAIYGGSLGGFIRTTVTRCVGGPKAFNFPVGTGGDYVPVELSSIQGTGQFTVRPRSGPYSSAATGLPTNRLQRYWEIANSGVSRADITFAYKQSDIIGQENGYFAFGIDAGVAQRMETHRSEASNRVQAWGVTSFAPVWTLAEVGFVYGKALNARGRPAVGVHVTLSDGVNPPQFRVTDSTGLYRFFDIDTHRAYTLTVASQRYVFPSPSVNIPVGGNMANISFVASTP